MGIQEQINILSLPIEKIKGKFWNPKTREDYMQEFERIKRGIEIDGILIPLVVREVENEMYEIVDGEQRFAVYQDAGVKNVTVNNLGKISEVEAKAKAVNLENRVPLDYFKTSLLFEDIVNGQGLEELLKMTSYSKEDIEHRLDALAKMKLNDLLPDTDLELVTEPEREAKLNGARRYFIRINLADLNDLLNLCGG